MTTRSASKPKPKPSKKYLIGRPVSAQSSVTGRCTKAFIAFDLQKRRMCFVKDGWRPLAPRVHPEWEVYKRLKEHDVKGVATAIAGGDVQGSEDKARQSTLTEEYLPGGPETKPVKRVHCRLAIKQVGRSLDTYKDSEQLMSVVYQALLGAHSVFSPLATVSKPIPGHRDAWELARILHRDVSVGNIMIDVESPEDDPAGFLNDWDLCKFAEDLDKPASQPAGRSVSCMLFCDTLATHMVY